MFKRRNFVWQAKRTSVMTIIASYLDVLLTIKYVYTETLIKEYSSQHCLITFEFAAGPVVWFIFVVKWKIVYCRSRSHTNRRYQNTQTKPTKKKRERIAILRNNNAANKWLKNQDSIQCKLSRLFLNENMDKGT